MKSRTAREAEKVHRPWRVLAAACASLFNRARTAPADSLQADAESGPLGAVRGLAPERSPRSAAPLVLALTLFVISALVLLDWCWQVDCYGDCERQQRSVARAIRFYAYLHEGELPTSLQALTDCDYLPAVPRCPSRHGPAYRYTHDPAGQFTLECAGRNHPPYGHNLPLWSTRREHR